MTIDELKEQNLNPCAAHSEMLYIRDHVSIIDGLFTIMHLIGYLQTYSFEYMREDGPVIPA